MLPDALVYLHPLLKQFRLRSFKVAGIPHHNRVDHQTERRCPVELGLIAAIREASLVPKGDITGQRVQALTFVESNQHPSPEWGIIDIVENVSRFPDSPQLLDRLLKRVLSLHRLEFGDDERGAYQPVFQ